MGRLAGVERVDGRRDLTLVLLPVEAWFWFGFDLPIPKAIGVVRIVLLAIGWSALG